MSNKLDSLLFLPIGIAAGVAVLPIIAMLCGEPATEQATVEALEKRVERIEVLLEDVRYEAYRDQWKQTP